MNINDIATAVWNNDTAVHLASHYMIRDENGNFNLAKITTSSGHFLVADVDEAEDGTYITYSVYVPSDEDMADPITTDGFKSATEEHAAARLAGILSGY